MHVASLDCKECTAGIEVLELELALGAAVYGIRPLATEKGHVEVVSTTPDLLIGVECNTYLTMLNLRVSLQIGNSCHNLGNTGLVIGSQKSVSIGNHKLMAGIVLHLGEIGNAENNIILCREHDVATVVFDYVWFHILTTHIGACIKVRNETYYGQFLVGICRQCGIEVAFII